MSYDMVFKMTYFILILFIILFVFDVLINNEISIAWDLLLF